MSPIDPHATAPTSQSSDRQYGWLVGLVLVAGAWLRLTGLEVHSFWFDECHTAYLATAPDTIALLHGDRHPPFSFLAYKYWIQALGENDATIRLLPAILSCVSLVLFGRLARQWTDGSAWLIALALYAVAPFHVWHAQEARMYAFLELGAVLALCGIARSLRGRIWSGACMIFTGQAIALGSQYMGILLLPTAVVIAGVAFALHLQPFRRAAALAASSLCGALIWLPWLVSAVPDQLNAVWGYAAKLTPRDLAELPARQILTELSAIPPAWRLAGVLVAAVLSVGFLLSVVQLVRHFVPHRLWPVLAFFLPVAAALVAAFLGPRSFAPKYLMVASAGTALMVAAGLHFIPWRYLRWGAVVIAVGGALGLSVLHREGNLREDFRAACREVEAKWQPNDVLVSVTGTPEGHSQSSIRHYLRDRPDILQSIVSPSELRSSLGLESPSVGRVHVVYRDAGYARNDMVDLQRRLTLVERSPDRLRVTYFLLALPRG